MEVAGRIVRDDRFWEVFNFCIDESAITGFSFDVLLKLFLKLLAILLFVEVIIRWVSC